jgi:hypothetical protein
MLRYNRFHLMYFIAACLSSVQSTELVRLLTRLSQLLCCDLSPLFGSTDGVGGWRESADRAMVLTVLKSSAHLVRAIHRWASEAH